VINARIDVFLSGVLAGSKEGGISSSTENITIRAHRALRASFSVPSFLPIASGQQSGTLRLRSPRFADTPTRRYADTPSLWLRLRRARNQAGYGRGKRG
jgi:hypothetical protein